MTTNLVVMETMREAVMRLRDHPCSPRWRSFADANVGIKPITGNELEQVPVHVISVSAGLTFVSVGIHDKDCERRTLTQVGS